MKHYVRLKAKYTSRYAIRTKQQYLVADVLQRLITSASSTNLISRPLDDSLPCPVIQYAGADPAQNLRGDPSEWGHNSFANWGPN